MKFERIIKLGDRGNDVSYLQTKLMEYGFYNDTIDGIFGHKTNFAVLNFQKSLNIKQDGIIGLLTWSNITSYKQLSPEYVKPGFTLKPSIVSDNGLTIYDKLLDDSEYTKIETIKDTIMLHHTSGGSRPDWTIDGLETDFLKDKNGNIVFDANQKPISFAVTTSYIIGRKSSSDGDDIWDGKILRSFDDKYWAYHAGIDNKEFESKSIGIEVCNYGGLKMGKDGRFYNQVNKPILDSEVIALDKPFKGYTHFEKYTDAQIESLRKLIIYLIKKHGINISHNIYDASWFDYNPSWVLNGGLRNHSQVRPDKFDMFPQPELIQMLNTL